jgi:hypothetical protein
VVPPLRGTLRWRARVMRGSQRVAQRAARPFPTPQPSARAFAQRTRAGADGGRGEWICEGRCTDDCGGTGCWYSTTPRIMALEIGRSRDDGCDDDGCHFATFTVL